MEKDKIVDLVDFHKEDYTDVYIYYYDNYDALISAYSSSSNHYAIKALFGVISINSMEFCSSDLDIRKRKIDYLLNGNELYYDKIIYFETRYGFNIYVNADNKFPCKFHIARLNKSIIVRNKQELNQIINEYEL